MDRMNEKKSGTSRKLQLNRETLRELTHDEARQVLGGGNGSGSWALGCRNSSCCWTN